MVVKNKTSRKKTQGKDDKDKYALSQTGASFVLRTPVK
jgi:hypothetical protein